MLDTATAAFAIIRPKGRPRLTAEQQSWVDASSRVDVAGWIRVRVSGAPHARGFAHGYLVATEYADAVRAFTAMTLESFGVTDAFVVEHAARMHADRLTAELRAELEGLAAGLTAAGVPTTLDELIGWNAWLELTDHWWPTVAWQYATAGPKGPRGAHGSGFVATGSATADGEPVLGHSSIEEFWAGRHRRVLLDLTPDTGHRVVMPTMPGAIGGVGGVWLTGGGLGLVATALDGFRGYVETKAPDWARARVACQYAESIDEWVDLMNEDGYGGCGTAWLLADATTGEIARYEEGLAHQSLVRTKNGALHAAGTAVDPRIRHLECAGTGYSDVRQPTGARRVAWRRLLDRHDGAIDAATGRAMLADTEDAYLGGTAPSSRGVCAHYDADPRPQSGDPDAAWSAAFLPAGSVDGTVASAADIRSLSLWGRAGRPDGVPFDADAFLHDHPQFAGQAPHLRSLPSQPWVHLAGDGASPIGA